MRRTRALIVVVGLLMVSCLSRRSVVRVEDGREVRGRFVSPEAYKDFLLGALSEARGDLRRARSHYERVLDDDDASVEAWSGLGRVLCAESLEAARRAFSRAAELGDGLSTPFLSAAGCERAAGNTARALVLAEQAARRSPASPEVTAFLAETLHRAGRTEEATRWLRGLELLGSTSRGSQHGSQGVPSAPPSRPPGSATLASALRRFRADPRDSDARITLLVAADLEGDEAAFEDASRRPGTPMEPPSQDAARMLQELLARRVGDGAARTFGEAYGAEEAGRPGFGAGSAP